MKAGDDMYVNNPSILDLLGHGNEGFSLRKLSKDASPIRNKDNKWYMSYEDYPNKTEPRCEKTGL